MVVEANEGPPNNSLQATAGAVAFELWPPPRIAKSQSGRHEGNNMFKRQSDSSAIMPARLRVPPCRVWPNPAAPEFGRWAEAGKYLTTKRVNYSSLVKNEDCNIFVSLDECAIITQKYSTILLSRTKG